MINPDWKLFETKFSENPQKNFEWFCYLLFCKEFDKPYGIPRIYNQPGIETFLIQQGGEVIGWQAKYYSGKLTDHKDDIIDSIEKSKKNFKILEKHLSVIVSRKKENNEYFEYVQNYLNEVEQKVYN